MKISPKASLYQNKSTSFGMSVKCNKNLAHLPIQTKYYLEQSIKEYESNGCLNNCNAYFKTVFWGDEKRVKCIITPINKSNKHNSITRLVSALRGRKASDWADAEDHDSVPYLISCALDKFEKKNKI